MFELLTVQDLVEVLPSRMASRVTNANGSSSIDDGLLPAVEAAVTAKYAFKVMAGTQSVVVGVAAVTKVGLARLSAGSPSGWVGATFDLIVFRPRVHERLKARIHKQDAHGIYLTTEFFDGIFIPAHLLNDPSLFDPVKCQWRHIVDEASGASATFDNGSEVIFAVHAVIEGVSEVERAAEEQRAIAATATQTGGKAAKTGATTVTTLMSAPALTVSGSFAEPGLGPVAWFEFAADDDDGGDAAPDSH